MLKLRFHVFDVMDAQGLLRASLFLRLVSRCKV